MGSKKIVLAQRYLTERDLERLRGEDLSFVLLPKPDLMDEADIEKLHEEAADADLVIIAMFGSNPKNVGRLKLDQITARKAYWSFDSHHQWDMERALQPLFDAFFIAHAPYRKYFTKVKTHWLPCAYVRFDDAKILELMNTDPYAAIKEYDLVFPHQSYAIGHREVIAQRALESLGSNKMFSGPAESGEEYTRRLQSGRVVLNIPLLGELNIRCFEAWLYNRILLTCRAPESSWLDELSGAAVFFQPDMSDFEQRLEEALELSVQPCNTAPLVLNRHMQIHRYASLINTMLETRLEVCPVADQDAVIVPAIPKTASRAVTIAGHGLNVGVIALSQEKIAAAPHFCATRLQIEDNIGEAIHIHWRNLRLDYTVNDFFRSAREIGRSLAGLGARINAVADSSVMVSESYRTDLGELAEAISNVRLEKRYLDDMRILLRKNDSWGAYTIQESPAWEALAGNSAEYAHYHAQFSGNARTPQQLTSLIKSILINGYPFQQEFITLHDGEPYIRDGQHRAVILRYFFGNIEIPVCIFEFKKTINAKMNLFHGKNDISAVNAEQVQRVLCVFVDNYFEKLYFLQEIGMVRDMFSSASITVACQDAYVSEYEQYAFLERVIALPKAPAENIARNAHAIKLLQACRPDLVFYISSQKPDITALRNAIGVPVMAVESKQGLRHLLAVGKAEE